MIKLTSILLILFVTKASFSSEIGIDNQEPQTLIEIPFKKKEKTRKPSMNQIERELAEARLKRRGDIPPLKAVKPNKNIEGAWCLFSDNLLRKVIFNEDGTVVLENILRNQSESTAVLYTKGTTGGSFLENTIKEVFGFYLTNDGELELTAHTKEGERQLIIDSNKIEIIELGRYRSIFLNRCTGS